MVKNRNLAFTMAEILISLTIIGIIAAITLPALQGNINEKTWATQKKALYSRMSQALSLMPSLNGYGVGSTNAETMANAAMAFVTDGLSKVIKINNVCDHEHLADCGISTTYTNMADTVKNFPTKLSEFNSKFVGSITSGGITYTNTLDTVAAAFETQNGESILVLYQPQCIAEPNQSGWQFSQRYMCANLIYDLNGSKGPNTVGKDIGFITALYPTDSNIVAPMASSQDASEHSSQTDASNACRAQDENSRIPNIDELSAIFYNRDLVGIPNEFYWSGNVESETKAWVQHVYTGQRSPDDRAITAYRVRCVKR